MLTVAEIIEEAGAPAGSVSILPMSRELGDRMVADERFKLLTFTGSPSVGWRMKERAGKKKVVLELGGNAGVIVDKTADLDWAVKPAPRRRASPMPARSASASSGCSSTRTSGTTFMDRFVEGARTIKVGDPLDPQTELGPMVDAAAAERTQRWVDEAVAMGGKVLARRQGRRHLLPADDPDRRPAEAQVCSNEAFAPLVVAFPFRTSATRSDRSTTRCSGSRPASSRTT